MERWRNVYIGPTVICVYPSLLPLAVRNPVLSRDVLRGLQLGATFTLSSRYQY